MCLEPLCYHPLGFSVYDFFSKKGLFDQQYWHFAWCLVINKWNFQTNNKFPERLFEKRLSQNYIFRGFYWNSQSKFPTWLLLLSFNMLTGAIQELIYYLFKSDFNWFIQRLRFWCWKLSNKAVLLFFMCFHSFQHEISATWSTIILFSKVITPYYC